MPPIHYAISLRKLKSLKCMLETVDRMRGNAAELVGHAPPLPAPPRAPWLRGGRLTLRTTTRG